MSESLTRCGGGKRSRHSWCMRNPQFYVSGKRLMAISNLIQSRYNPVLYKRQQSHRPDYPGHEEFHWGNKIASVSNWQLENCWMSIFERTIRFRVWLSRPKCRVAWIQETVWPLGNNVFQDVVKAWNIIWFYQKLNNDNDSLKTGRHSVNMVGRYVT